MNIEPDLVHIPAGTFWMGSTEAEVHCCVDYWADRLVEPSYSSEQFRSWILKEYPAHPVLLPAFCMGRFPVTNEQYNLFVKATGARAPESLQLSHEPDHPVWGVSHREAVHFTVWLSELLSEPFRLPTEAEWEYAARGPVRQVYPFGDEFDPIRCNTAESQIGHTTPVHQYPTGASVFRVWDMAGNVEEWTASTYAPYPGGEPIQDDLYLSLGPCYRILRGGSFARGGDLARAPRRHGRLPQPQFRYTGFRIASSGTKTAHKIG